VIPPRWRWRAITGLLAGVIAVCVTAVHRPWWIWAMAAVALGLVPEPEWAKAEDNEEDE
jgi:hypothetical protein